jgi:hypothetical protein
MRSKKASVAFFIYNKSTWFPTGFFTPQCAAPASLHDAKRELCQYLKFYSKTLTKENRRELCSTQLPKKRSFCFVGTKANQNFNYNGSILVKFSADPITE